MGLEIEVRVEAEVYPTEDPEKVLEAVKKVFPEIDFNVKWLDGSAVVEGVGKDLKVLENLKRLIRERRIRTSARQILKSSILGDSLIFNLNKQAAYVGKISFTEPYLESPLPPIKVEVRSDDLEAVIEWLTEI